MEIPETSYNTDEERFMRVTRGDIPDLDAALAWAVQTVDKLAFEHPSILIEACTVYTEDGEEEGVQMYTVAVYGDVSG